MSLVVVRYGTEDVADENEVVTTTSEVITTLCVAVGVGVQVDISGMGRGGRRWRTMRARTDRFVRYSPPQRAQKE